MVATDEQIEKHLRDAVNDGVRIGLRTAREALVLLRDEGKGTLDEAIVLVGILEDSYGGGHTCIFLPDFPCRMCGSAERSGR